VTGIAGLVRLDGSPAVPADLDAMLARMPTRAAGGVATLVSGSVAMASLGSGSTAVSPGASETRPMVAGDVRLDNRAELLSLLAVGEDGTPIPDLGLVRLAYERWGAEMGPHLFGDFALAVWDPSRSRLVCIRDRFGTKPFVYHRSDRLFAFASQPVGVLALEDVPREVDELAIALFLVDEMPDEAGSFYRAIRRLPPGHVLDVEIGGSQRSPRPYWQLDPERDVRLASDEEYEQGFRALLLEAVRCRLPEEGEVGIAFSGGVDSSSIVRAAAELAGDDRTIRTYTMTSAGAVPNERPFVDAVLARGGVASTLIPDTDVPATVRARVRDGCADSPYMVVGLLMEGVLYDAASADGAMIVLDGFDGDTVVSHGIARLTDLAVSGRFLSLVREVRGLSTVLGWNPADTLRAQVLGPLVPSQLRRDRGFPGSAIDRSFARRIRLDEAVAERHHQSPSRPFARTEHFRDLTSPMNSLTLEIMESVASRAGVDLRHPFFDSRLAEFCLGLPADQKLRDGWPRSIQRRAIRGLVPDAVRWRPHKTMLGPTLAAQILTPVWAEVTDLARSGGGVAAAYVDARVLRDAYMACARTASANHAVLLWDVFLLDRWLREVGLGLAGDQPCGV
jgi:asparagine synthase (glutamine-hydrolysing)